MSDEYIREADIINIPLPDKSERNYITYNHDDTYEQGYQEALDKAASLPSADVVQIVHGEWEYIDDTYCGFEDTDVRCSVCKTITNIKRFRKTKWCPDCGALMDGERREE